jgi:hypothetical protein
VDGCSASCGAEFLWLFLGVSRASRFPGGLKAAVREALRATTGRRKHGHSQGRNARFACLPRRN